MNIRSIPIILMISFGLVFSVMGQQLINYVEDPGFEWGVAFEDTTQLYEPGGPPGWTGWFSNSFVDELRSYTGNWCATIEEIPVEGDYDDGGFGQIVDGLTPGGTYLMTAFARLDWFTGTDFEWGAYLGVQAFGRDKVQANFTATEEWFPVVLQFVMGDTNTWVDVWGWRGPGGEASFDDFGIWDDHNFLANGGFEAANLDDWWYWEGYNVVINSDTAQVLAGAQCLEINGVDWGGGCAQLVTDLKPGVTYGLQSSLKVVTEGDTVYFGVKNYSANPEDEKFFKVGNTAYTQGTLFFTMPEGYTEAEIYVWKDGIGQAFCDNFLLCTMIDAAATSIEDQETITVKPLTHALKQNYPNPFNPSTTIQYSLPKAEDVRLAVYDITGRMVKSLINESISQGVHTIQWNGMDDFGRPVSSGLYFYKIEAGNFSETKKLILIR